jgi:hypothetical protein
MTTSIATANLTVSKSKDKSVKGGSIAPSSSSGPRIDRQAKLWHRLCSIRVILPTTFAVQVIVIVVVIWAIGFFNSQRSINSLSLQLQQEITSEIDQKTDSLLNQAPQIEAIILAQFKTDVMTLDSVLPVRNQLRPLFLSYPLVTGIYIGTQENMMVGYLRVPYTDYATYYFTAPNNNTLYTYRIENTTTAIISAPVESIYAPTARPWYQLVVADQAATWTDVYVDYSGTFLSVRRCRCRL